MRAAFVVHKPWTLWWMAPLALLIATGGRIGGCDCDGASGPGQPAALESSCCAAEREVAAHEPAAPASDCPQMGSECPADLCHCADADGIVGEPARLAVAADHVPAHAILASTTAYPPRAAPSLRLLPSLATGPSHPPPLYVIHCSYRC